MKPDRRYFRDSLIMLSAVLCLTVNTSRAVDAPGFREIVTQSLAAATQPVSYSVIIHQTIEFTATNVITGGNGAAPVARSALRPVTEYKLHFAPGRGFTREKMLPASQESSIGTSIPAAAEAKVSINVAAFLENFGTWGSGSVTEEALGKTLCHKLAATKDGNAATLWVDPENRCVVKILTDIRGHRFSETFLTYRHDEEHGWLLATADTRYAGDGSHVLLEYGEYDFRNP